jgi:hypothetical protein
MGQPTSQHGQGRVREQGIERDMLDAAVAVAAIVRLVH